MGENTRIPVAVMYQGEGQYVLNPFNELPEVGTNLGKKFKVNRVVDRTK